MAANTTKGTTVAFGNTPQAANDFYSFTESVESSVQYLDVMANDLGGNAKSLYSIDDGRNADGSANGSRTSDLLQQDAVNALGTSALGARIWITADGKIAYDTSTLGDLDYLAQGQHLTDSFTYAIRLANGTISWATATVDIVGQNDPIVITAQDLIGAVTEQVTPAGNLTDSGGISFTDLDLTDVHLVSATGTPVGTGLGSLTAVRNSDTTGTGAGGQLTWTYTVADSAVEYLAKDQTKVESFTITLNDQHGSIITKQIDVTITGTNDAPVITSAAQTGSVSEGDNGASMTATGLVSFTDVDLTDTHVFSVSAAATHGTAGVAADGSWTYTVSDTGAVDALAAGAHLSDSFTVKVADNHGGFATQVVNIDIVGTNDAPVVQSPHVYKDVTEDDGLKFETAAEFLTKIQAFDPDGDQLSMVNFTMTATDAGNPVAIPQGAVTVTSNLDGTFASATLDTNKFDYLRAGESVTLTADYDVVDGHGGSTHAQGIKTVTGVNDGPVAAADSNAADAVVEAGVTPAAPINPANGLAGTWLGNGSDFSALTLFADGRYMFMEGGGQPPNGGEAGTWAYDAAAGKIALHNTFDGNVGGGLAPDQNDIFNPVSFNAAQIALTIFNPDVNATVTLAGTRQAVSTGIAGTWLNTPTADAPFTALVLFDDHRFMYMEGGGLPPNGLEAGTYSYNPVTGALQFFTTFDSNNDGSGTGGLSPTLDGVTLTAVLNGDTLSVSGAPTDFLPMHRQFSVPSSPPVDPAFAGDATAVGNVLSNDTDVDAGAILTVSEVNGLAGKVGVTVVGTYGSVVIGSDGSYSYTLNNADPDTNALAQGASASDVFNYTVSDEFGATSSSTLTINITGTNDAPLAVADSNAGDAVVEAGVTAGNAPFAGDNTAVGNVLANDTDVDAGDGKAVTSIGVFTGTYGTLTLGALGNYTYKLNNADPDTNVLAQGAHAQDVFHYIMRDSAGASSESTLTIDIAGTNDKPVITSAAQAGTVSEGDPAHGANMTATGIVTYADVDAGDTHAFSVSAAATHGTAGVAADGSWSYTVSDTGAVDALAAGAHLSDSFTVKVADNHGGFATQVVNIDIVGTNDAPVTHDDSASGVAGTTITTGNVLINDSDVDSVLTAASITGNTQGAHGAVAYNHDGTFNYTPEAGFSGSDSFVYTLSDGSLSSTATVSVTVSGPMSVSNFTTLTYPVVTPAGHGPAPAGWGLANDVNNLGQIAGHSETYFDPSIQGFDGWVYSNGSFTTIHIGNQNVVEDINSFGILAGFESPNNSTPRYGFIQNGATVTTIDLSPDISTTVNGINDAGNFVGSSYLHAGTTYSGYANIGGVYTYLNPFGSTDTHATGINNLNDIIGIYSAGGVTHAYLDHSGVFTHVDNPLALQTIAFDINNAGQIAGYYEDASHHWHGYIDTDGVFTTIDNPLATGSGGTQVNGINDAGQVVGAYYDGSNVPHAFVATLNNPVGQSTNDVLVASPQGSMLVGGAGNDTFVFNFAPLTQSTIADFVHGQDMLQISAAGFDHGLTTGATPTLLIGAPAAVSGGGGGYFIFDNFDPTGGTLYWDATGGSGADAVALVKLQGVTALLPSDFHLV